MKKLLILGFAAAFIFSSCEKDLSNTSKVSKSVGFTSTLADTKAPATADWRTTQQVSVDISGLSGSDAKQLIEVYDSHGNLLLTKLMKVNFLSASNAQIPSVAVSTMLR